MPLRQPASPSFSIQAKFGSTANDVEPAGDQSLENGRFGATRGRSPACIETER